MKKYIVLFAILFTVSAQAQVFTPFKFLPRFNASVATQSTKLTGPDGQTLKNAQIDTTEWVSFLPALVNDTLFEAAVYTPNGDSIESTVKAQFGLNGTIVSTGVADSFNYHKPTNALVGTVPAKGKALWFSRGIGANQVRFIVSTVVAKGGYKASPAYSYRVGLITRTKIDK